MNKIKIQEVIVVEGKDDTANLRRFYEVDTYETRGSAINEDDLERISKSNLMKLGLLMGADSRKRREYLGEALRIGYCNGKQLLKRLELFGITLEELEEAMSNY